MIMNIVLFTLSFNSTLILWSIIYLNSFTSFTAVSLEFTSYFRHLIILCFVVFGQDIYILRVSVERRLPEDIFILIDSWNYEWFLKVSGYCSISLLSFGSKGQLFLGSRRPFVATITDIGSTHPGFKTTFSGSVAKIRYSQKHPKIATLFPTSRYDFSWFRGELFLCIFFPTWLSK